MIEAKLSAMEDEALQRVLERRGRYSSTSPPSPAPCSAAAASASSSSSILQSLPLHVSFDHGYYLLVKAIQELREKKDGHVVTVGIGGPSGSGKTRSPILFLPSLIVDGTLIS